MLIPINNDIKKRCDQTRLLSFDQPLPQSYYIQHLGRHLKRFRSAQRLVILVGIASTNSNMSYTHVTSSDISFALAYKMTKVIKGMSALLRSHHAFLGGWSGKKK